MILHSDRTYGRASHNLIQEVHEPDIRGARALVETFYYAFNARDLDTFSQVWAEHALIQLNNPLGGIMRGYEDIASLYRRILMGEARVWVELGDIVEFQTDRMVVLAGRETGEFTHRGETLALAIRTSRVVQWLGSETGWLQVHHHGSIDNPELLRAYQNAVK